MLLREQLPFGDAPRGTGAQPGAGTGLGAGASFCQESWRT